LVALDREIRRAREIAGGNGLIAVNVMKALSAYEAYVHQALVSGADAIVVGAGLPLDLPELARDFPKTALIPILSDARGVQLLVRKWEKKGRLPDAIIIEHPRYAGGHLGATRLEEVENRVAALERMFNIEAGATAADDALPPRFAETSIPVAGEEKSVSTAAQERMRLDYYAVRGWDADGRPKPELLEDLRIAPRTRRAS